MITRAFPFEAGKSVKITADKVAKHVETLHALGYKTALFTRDFVAGTFSIQSDPANGFSVSHKPLSGLAPVTE